MITNGKNAGVTGILSCIVDGITSSTYTYDIVVEGWDFSQFAKVVDRSGYSASPAYRFEEFRGKGTFKGKPQLAAYPFPAGISNATGTLTLTQNIKDGQLLGSTANAYISFPALINEIEVAGSNSKNLWGISGAWLMNGSASINWGGTQISASAPVFNTATTYEVTRLKYDPENLVMAAIQKVDAQTVGKSHPAEVTMIAAYIATATPPIVGLKIYDVDWSRTGDSGGAMILDWRKRTSKDNTLFPSTYGSRPPNAPWVDSVPSLVVAAGSVFDQATAIANASQGTPFLSSIIVTPETDGLRKVTLKYTDPGIMFRGKGTGGGRYVNARLNGTAMQVYVLSNLAMGTSSQRRIQLSRLWITTSSDLQFTIDRAVVGTVIPRQNPDQINGTTMPFYGQVNSAIFEGLTQNSCMYISSVFSVKKAASGSMTMFMRYTFQQDDYSYFINEIPEDYFVRVQNLTTTITSQGWTTASLLGITLVRPTAASFSAFEA